MKDVENVRQRYGRSSMSRTTSIWEDIQNTGSGGFTPEENWGDSRNVNGFLLWALFLLRIETGWPIVIHNAVEYTGHSENSQHYKKNAADWHFVTDTPYHQQIDRVVDILTKKQMAPFMGIGIYPDWNSPGFHTDARGFTARWGYVKDNPVDSQRMVGWDEAYKKAKEVE
jgi:hypothetical protein